MEKYVVMLRTDLDDRDITEWAMAETGTNIPVKFIDGKEDLDALIAASGDPCLLLVNDRGAAHKGHERLKHFKSNPSYNHIPVIVLGEVSTRDYIRECYRAGANSFIVKPSTVAETKKKVSDFFNYWLCVAEC
jgi:response regulator RpfG family c-di-GMP phosphodiesterase